MCLPYEPALVGMIAAGTAAILPDLDAVGLTGKILKPIIGHRTATHSLLGTLIFGFFVKEAMPTYWIFAAAGYASHVLADLLTVSGVMLFYPFGGRSQLPLCKNNGLIERFFVLPAALIAIIYTAKTFFQ